MQAAYCTLAEFEAAVPGLAADALAPLYYESDGAGEFVVTPEHLWLHAEEVAEFEGKRVVRRPDESAAKALFLPIAAAALAATPQPAVPYAVPALL